MTMSNTIRFSLKVGEGMGKQIIEEAERTGRNKQRMICHMIERYFDVKDSQKTIDNSPVATHIIWAVYIPLFLFIAGRINNNDALLFSLGIASLGGIAIYLIYNFTRSNNDGT